MVDRNDLARPRGGFKLREDGTLETGQCGTCKGETYRTGEGKWLHWSTLGEGCPQEASVTVKKVPFGPRVEDCTPSVLDSPTRGLARAGLSATYRRASWEWMGCR